MKLSEKANHGVAVINEMHGAEAAAQVEKMATSGKFAHQLSAMALEFVFADAWGRPGLTPREKSLLTISALIATKQPDELKNHIRLGVLNGLSVDDFENILIQLVPYLGFPAVSSVSQLVKQTLSQAGVNPDQRHHDRKHESS